MTLIAIGLIVLAAVMLVVAGVALSKGNEGVR
jgi:hypothetical protein